MRIVFCIAKRFLNIRIIFNYRKFNFGKKAETNESLIYTLRFLFVITL